VKFCTLPPVWRAVKDAHNGGEPTNPLDVSIHASGRRLRHSDRWVVRLASGSSAGMAASRGLMRRASSPREATGLDLRSKFDVAGGETIAWGTGNDCLVNPPQCVRDSPYRLMGKEATTPLVAFILRVLACWPPEQCPAEKVGEGFRKRRAVRFTSRNWWASKAGCGKKTLLIAALQAQLVQIQ